MYVASRDEQFFQSRILVHDGGALRVLVDVVQNTFEVFVFFRTRRDVRWHEVIHDGVHAMVCLQLLDDALEVV